MEIDLFYLKHCRYFYTFLTAPLSSKFLSFEPILTTLIQFGVTGLGALNALSILSEEEKKYISDFLISLYIPGHSSTAANKSTIDTASGFRPGPFIGNSFSPKNV